MSILDVKNLTHTFGDRKLFNNASMQLFGGDKMGLCGLNGVGKSTFMGFLTDNLLPDEGYVKWHPKKTFGYLDQQATIDPDITIKDYLCKAYEHLYKADEEINAIGAKLAEETDPKVIDELLDKLAKNQDLLDSNNFYSISAEVEKVAAGLGLTSYGLDTPVGQLSGGSRAKVMLSKLLLCAPDVFLLDEPTNFLDKVHIDWLAKYLASFKGTFIIISHDTEFLDKVVNCICDIQHGEIVRFNGTYSEFLKQKEQKEIQYQKNYAAQQKQIAKLEEYVEKNIARASTSKMAKSRRKQLEKIEVMDAPNTTPPPTFRFSYQPCAGHTALWVNDLAIGYTEQLLPEINLMVGVKEKVAVSGFNGIGKTTFLKTLCGYIPSLRGSFKLADKITIGYYEQENLWDNPSRTPVEELKERFPRKNDKELRAALATCGVSGEKMMRPISTLSGGEQAKVKIAILTLTPCSILFLDEPTNHLDVDAVECLGQAICEFEGCVIFVSHNETFSQNNAERTFNLEALFD